MFFCLCVRDFLLNAADPFSAYLNLCLLPPSPSASENDSRPEKPVPCAVQQQQLQQPQQFVIDSGCCMWCGVCVCAFVWGAELASTALSVRECLKRPPAVRHWLNLHAQQHSAGWALRHTSEARNKALKSTHTFSTVPANKRLAKSLRKYNESFGKLAYVYTSPVEGATFAHSNTHLRQKPHNTRGW